jgi:hypothetical protein
MPLDVWAQIAVAIIGAGAVYGGIRADIKNIHERISDTSKSAGRAHDRIDRHVEQFHTRRED